MVIRHEDERVVRVLKAQAVLQGADEVPEVERTCRPITRQHPRPTGAIRFVTGACVVVCIERFNSSASMIPRVEPAQLRRLGDTLNGDGLGGQTRIDLVRCGARPDRVGGGQDLPTQSLVDLLERPRERRPVLGPFEVADDDPTRVAQDVGQDDDTVAAQDRVGVGRSPGRWPLRPGSAPAPYRHSPR